VAEDDEYAKRRRLVLGSVVFAVAILFLRVTLATHSVVAGLAVVGAFGGVGWWLVARSRAKTERAIGAPGGVLSVDASLDFASVPREWRAMAHESQGPLGGQTPALAVTVRAEAGWLTIEKRRILGAGKTPFRLQVPLAAVTAVEVGRPKIGLVGSSLTFRLSGNDDLVLDVLAGAEPMKELAHRYQDAAQAARWGAAPGPLRLELTTPPPPARTPPARAGVMLLVCTLPFAAAMAGAVDGPAAAVAAFFLVMTALVLTMIRPMSMGRILRAGAWITAGGFVVDAVATGQPLRLLGGIVCIAAGAWLGSRPTPAPAGS